MGSIISLLKPDHTWPCPVGSTINQTTPSLPYIPGPRARRLCGAFHELLWSISQRYCAWLEIPFDSTILQLPFGLILKWSDRASIEEVAAMKMARAAGMPVPWVLTCGEHPNNLRGFSILMTRLPGVEVINSDEELDVELEQPWLSQLQACLNAMRNWESPYADSVCSVLGTKLRSTRVPNHKMGPFATQAEMLDFLLSTRSSHSFSSTEDYEAKLRCANAIRSIPHRLKFTHGDFKAHNILVGHNNELTGFLDWESGGWYPEYWEFTTAMRWGRDSWWYQVAAYMGGQQYQEQLECDRALNDLTVDSYIFL